MEINENDTEKPLTKTEIESGKEASENLPLQHEIAIPKKISEDGKTDDAIESEKLDDVEKDLDEKEANVDQSFLSLIEEQTSENETAENSPRSNACCKCIYSFYNTNSFLIHIILAILIAFAYPEFGYLYLYPKITATWIAVIIIFFLSGISLKTEEFKNAFKRLGFNLFVQCYNFGFVSVFMYGITRLIISLGIIAESLADGMMICACVPITVNMVLVLTKSSNGDEAAAVFNAAFGNMLGVFISPLLILLYLGQNVSIDIGQVFYKLCLRVVLPIFVGQLIHRYSEPIVAFTKNNKKLFKAIQEYCLIFIVYTVFCTTFYEQRKKGTQDNGDGAQSINSTSVVDAVIMIAFLFVILSTVMVIAWFLLKWFYPSQPALRVMGLFGCSHKSIAMGIPLINAIYEDNPNIGFYTLPLLIWHPMQLVIGTFLSPRLSAFVTREEERIQSEQSRDNIPEVMEVK